MSGISLNLNEDQQMIREGAHDFAKEFIRPVAAHHDETGQYPWEVLRAAHQNGLMNTHIEEENGGLALTAMDGLLLAEELAWPEVPGFDGLDPVERARQVGVKVDSWLDAFLREGLLEA